VEWGDDFGETTVSAETLGDRLLLLVMVANGVKEYDLASDGEYTVGRSPSAEIRIEAPSVSRRHAQIVCKKKRVFVLDLKSTNGTKVNGDRLGKTAVEIAIGDAIRFGDVIAQLRSSRAARAYSPSLVLAHELDTRLADEAERCVRYDRSVAALALEVTSQGDEDLNRAKASVLSNLRTLDAAAVRGPGRIDILIVECTRAEALDRARRIHRDLADSGLTAKAGLAAFPGDVVSSASLLLAAQLAMHTAGDDHVGQAREGVRMLQIGDRDIIVAEPAMVRLFALIDRVASTPMPVLVHGETGSGKEIVAEALHQLGNRSKARLVQINCAAVPETLLESELFGYEKGAFSGAVGTKPGLFEEADGGTLFLDEIGEMKPPLQAKLLRVLEDKRVRRVGATSETAVDVRVVAATHRDLRTATASGTFRQDLFYRLSAIVLEVPPLRERQREIPLLAERFAAEACEQAGKNLITISQQTLAALRDYEWPGNIRELRNVISAAAMLCDEDEIRPSHLPPELADADPDAPAESHGDRADTAQITIDRRIPLEEMLRNVERDEIIRALDECQGNQTKAAKLLGMPRRTLVYKLTSLQIEAPRSRKGKRRQPSNS